jgi:hypothetical protein
MKRVLITLLLLSIPVLAQDGTFAQTACNQQIVQLSSSASYSLDDTPVLIPGLTHTVEAGGHYLFRAVIPGAGALGGLQIRIGGTSTDEYFVAQYVGRRVSGEIIQSGRAMNRITALHIIGATAFDVIVEGAVEIKEGGTFGIMAAQVAPHSSPSTVIRGASLSMTRTDLGDPTRLPLDNDTVKTLGSAGWIDYHRQSYLPRLSVMNIGA